MICGDVGMVAVDAGDYRKAAGRVANGGKIAPRADVRVEVPEASTLGDSSGSGVRCCVVRFAVQE